MIAGLSAAGAYAQNPAGATSEQEMITNTKPQLRAQAKDNAKPQGKVKKPVGDEAMTAQDDAIGTGKAAAAGQADVAKRDEHHPNRKQAKQDGTPDMPDAK
jgi:hypothetical protein